MATRAPESPGATGGAGGEDDEVARVVLRPMTGADLPEVLAIERATFTVPWTPATFHGLLRRGDAHLRVAELDGTIVGYSAVWIVLDQAELGDIAVAEAWRGRGIGRRLLEAVLTHARELGVRELYLEVRVTNDGARRLYTRYGFVEVGRRKNYYDRPREDALVMLKTLA